MIRAAIKDIGYEQDGFHWKTANIEILLHPQSADIAQGVDAQQPTNGRRRGRPGHHVRLRQQRDAGTDAGAALLRARDPAPDLAKRVTQAPRKCSARIPRARSRCEYEDGKPVGVREIVVSHQHLVEDMSSKQVRELVEPYIRKALPQGWISDKTVWHVNPTGKFFIGGPDGDTGLTGRKIIVDTYGGAAPHGGGAFSGKDSTKVDRSAAYAARYLAKNVVAAGLADKATFQLAYAIGVARPLSIYVDTHGTGKVAEDKLEKARRGIDGPDAARHPQASRSQQADLCAHLGLRPFRPQARCGWRLLLGEDRSRGQARNPR